MISPLNLTHLYRDIFHIGHLPVPEGEIPDNSICRRFQKSHVDITSLWKGDAYFALGEFESAIAAYDQGLPMDPGGRETFLRMAKAYFAIGEYEKTIAVCDQRLSNNLFDSDTKDLQEEAMEALSPGSSNQTG